MLKRAAGTVIVLGSVGWLLVGYIVAQLAAPHVLLAAAIVTLSAFACLVLVWLRFTPAGRNVLSTNRLIDLPGTIAVSLFLVALGTAGFAALSTALYKVGVGSVKGGP